MAGKIKLAVNWAAACGGCDVALLDSEERFLDLTAVADVVYWPVAMDFKREDLLAFGPGAIDVGIFNGAIRTSEQEEDARIMRERCKVLVAFGSCAAFGGVIGLANLHGREDILTTVYEETSSTDNPEHLHPQTTSTHRGSELSLPAFQATVKSLAHVVDVDYVVPGCPPPMEQVLDALNLIIDYAGGGELPEAGTVLAADKALCDECERVGTRTGNRISTFNRPHQVLADPELCFLEQGIVCLGISTRGGCGGKCIGVNMPCRGCFGATANLFDPGAEALSAIGSVAAEEDEDGLLPGKRLAVVRSIPDLAGTFYRYTLPSATLFRTLHDGQKATAKE